uniref:Myosin motor domain-containing protein n=1 Tax=Plectus sambesii TaxID=2011161 RepID=A0A914WEW7_9BILA
MDSFRDTKALKYLRPSQVGPMAAGLSAFGASELPAVEEPSTIWIPDDKLGYKLANVVERSDAGVVVKAKNKENVFEEMDIPSDETQEVNPSAFELCEDMASLTHLNEASVLHNLRQRFLLDLIHTFSGLFCVTINPWRWLPIYTDQVVQLYTGAQEHTPPHVFAIAQTAYSGILKGGGDQSILITGESGAGKTENTKKIIQYFTVVAGGGMSRMCKSATFNSALSSSSLEEQIAEMNPLLESFGNAKTTQNDNSSRFGKFIRIKFGSDGIVVGTEIESYLLEKSRVVSQNVSERSFHIFYQLLSEGFPASLKQALNLRMPASSYRFINRGGPDSDQVDSINDAVDAQHTDRALNTLGFSPDEKLYLYQMVAACLLMGQLKFTERTGFDQTFIDGTAEANDVCALIGLKTNRFVDGLTEPTMKVGDQLIRKSQNLEKTLFSVSAVAKSVYERTFKWIVTKCNSSLRAKGAGKQSLAGRLAHFLT